MSNSIPISDLHLFPLESSEERLIVLRDSDHLLRRFGQIDIVTVKMGYSTEMSLRAEADEIWVIFEGEVEAVLMDQRDGSPSRGETEGLNLNADDPHGILVPFGVAHSFKAIKDAKLVRISSHADGQHENDRSQNG